MDPNTPGSVIDADTDWSTLTSTNHLTDQAALVEPSNTQYQTSTYALAVDSRNTPSITFVGLGNSNDKAQATGGGICAETPATPGTQATANCTQIQISQGQPITNLVAGLAVGDDNGSGTVTVVAVVGHAPSGSGIYHTTYTYTDGTWGTWTEDTDSANLKLAQTDGAKGVQIWWGNVTAAYGQTAGLFIYDPDTGLWQLGANNTWTLQPASDLDLTNAKDGLGHMVGYATSSTLFLVLALPKNGNYFEESFTNNGATTPQVSRLGSSGSCWPTAASKIPGNAFTFDSSGTLYAAFGPTLGCPATLWKSDALVTGGTLSMSQISPRSGGFADQAFAPSGLAADSDSFLYVATAGDGVDVETPASRCPAGC